MILILKRTFIDFFLKRILILKYTVVLPFVHNPYKDECLATSKLDNVLLVDNTDINLGIMKSHNLGIDKMRADNSDWLIILSAAVRFGEPGGLDFIAEIEKRSNDLAVEAMPVFGWHLIAFNKKTIEKVGCWDENFTPYGYDDLDYSWRIQLAFALLDKGPKWTKVKIDVTDMGMAHSIHIGKIKTQNEQKLRKYYLKKWGGIPQPVYKHPFNDPKNKINYWPNPV